MEWGIGRLLFSSEEMKDDKPIGFAISVRTIGTGFPERSKTSLGRSTLETRCYPRRQSQLTFIGRFADMNTCATCDTSTPNLKFCSRSCAAKQNNHNCTQTRPQGSCARCTVAIPKRDRYCKPCSNEIRADRNA
jgi:hypothetical protein